MNEQTQQEIALLALQAQFLTDLEQVRIGTKNRIWAIENRFGLSSEDGSMNVAAEALGAGVAGLEKEAEKRLVQALKETEFYDIIEGMKGVGFKQGARLLGVIGHPCWKAQYERDEEGAVLSMTWVPRQLSSLYSYCGYAPVEVQDQPETQPTHDHRKNGTHDRIVRVAVKRKKGEQAQYNSEARTRCYLISESCMKTMQSPYRRVYDRGRAKYADAVHDVSCVRCGPSGKPAQPGSPLSDGHKHARALRLVAKRVLSDLWLAAGGEEVCGTQPWSQSGTISHTRRARMTRLEARAA